MSLPPGRRLGPYEIEEAIGAGGIPGYVIENRDVYSALPELFRTIGNAGLSAEEIGRMGEALRL